ncbi:MAG: hypothetical protein GX794_04760 [Acholeplasmataceae bacterium]|nr:hypothetical protein [Acholeplasmataceae bacterium]
MAYIKWMDINPKWLKVLLAVLIGIFWNLYRIVKSIGDKNILGIILGIILLVTGGFAILWIIDIVTLILSNKIIWF